MVSWPWWEAGHLCPCVFLACAWHPTSVVQVAHSVLWPGRLLVMPAIKEDMLGASSKPCFPIWRSVGVCGGGEVGPLYPQGLCCLLPADLLCGHWKLPTSLAWGEVLGPQWGGMPSAFLSWPQIPGRAKIADCPFHLLSFFHDNGNQLLTGHSSQHTLFPSLLCCDIWLHD